MPISENLKTVIWKPSGGLGHCLHNLAWVIKLCQDRKCKLYIYGFNLHPPFQYNAHEFLEFKKNGIDQEEIKSPEELDKFFKLYKISKESEKLVFNARYNTNVKYLVDDKSIAVICSTRSAKPKNLFKFNATFISYILDNPYKFFNNEYQLLKETDKSELNLNIAYILNISGSYAKALGVTNRQLNISKTDTGYVKELKLLKINYTTVHGKKKYVELIERTTHNIPDIKTIDKAIYGVRDKSIDITKKVLKKICTKNDKDLQNSKYIFSIEGSFFQKLRVSNKKLGITSDDKIHYNKLKLLQIKFKDLDGKLADVEIVEKTSKTIDNISEIIDAKYGIGEKWVNVKNQVINRCCKLVSLNDIAIKKNTPKISIQNQKDKIKNIVDMEKYIAVHFRFRDKKVKGGYIKKLREIKDAIKKTGIRNIFVATDSPMFFDYLSQNLKNVSIFRYTNPPTEGKNIHYNSKTYQKGEN